MEEKIILVDENDKEVGVEEKLKTHQEGKLHRAFSIFVFNSKGELLLQKRAKNKYHSGGLWSNTCCSHPRPGNPIEEEVHRRLKEEMGFDCELKEAFSFIYQIKFNENLSENEFDHVFIGKFDASPAPNPEEVEEWKWISMEDLRRAIEKNPENYTYWLLICTDKVASYTSKQNKKTFI